MALTRIQPPAIADVREPNFRNIVINGDMAVAQRGTSTTSNGYLVDRFIIDEATDGAITYTQDTDVPAGSEFANSIKLDCTTADASIGAAQYCILTTKFEGQNLQYLKYGTSSAQTLTLSFWVKSVKTGTYCVNFTKEAGSGTRYECPIEYTISSASTWEKKTIILSPTAGSTSLITGTAGAIVDSNASGFRVIFTLAAGTDWHGTNNTWVAASDKMSTSNQVNFLDSTSNNFWITGVQLEAGSVATDFEVVPYDQNLERCQRYYMRWQGDASDQRSIANGMAVTTSQVRMVVVYPITLRSFPTVTEADIETLNAAKVVTVVNLNATVDPGINAVNLQIDADSGTPYTVGQAISLRTGASTSSYLALSAEL